MRSGTIGKQVQLSLRYAGSGAAYIDVEPFVTKDRFLLAVDRVDEQGGKRLNESVFLTRKLLLLRLCARCRKREPGQRLDASSGNP